MGNSGIKKLFFPGEYVETKYKNFYELEGIDLDLNKQNFHQFEKKIILCTNVSSRGSMAKEQFQNLEKIQQEGNQYYKAALESHMDILKNQQNDKNKQKNSKNQKNSSNKDSDNQQIPGFNNNGFEILCFPSNQFYNEPGTFSNLKQIYLLNDSYRNLRFFGKVELNGQYASPIFKFLKRNSILYDYRSLSAEPIVEDFSKFLIDQNGQVIKYYRNDVSASQITKDYNKVQQIH
ncbi:Thioredoxin-like fold [Pseudocohnilembus persalinus]|uniref:Thioredoxin-like fold n=1 Tax=Pseudocohnilembus persalinus TaxID=266149 RepID=A0A0V0QGB2_PSEPJ|nr:Thioredoxin-like fold [Pseudocohnilembus persalinus]|eukprot:KRX01299.1 Thioredoxin-like fold [Pseudocohnilembus persalinus]